MDENPNNELREKVAPIRGMKDLYGVDFRKYQFIIDVATRIANKFGYQLIETPIVEQTAVFQRSLGDESDVVSKEMYSFVDKGGEDITLRPEGTAGVMRAISSNKLLVNNNNPLKLMYYGPMFRYDRPQKGRYRQFHQIGFEHIGEKSPYTDVVNIALAMDIFKNIGLCGVVVHINTLGGAVSREKYAKALVEYLNKYEQQLSAVSKCRLKKNPLRILDSKEPTDIDICTNAPKIQDFLTPDDKKYFDTVLELLKLWSIDYEVDPKLVRGLDYYTHTTFEFKIPNGSYQDALGGGGRYDGLLKLFGGNDISGVGFALGAERIMMLLNEKILPPLGRKVAVIPVSENEFADVFELMATLLDEQVPTELILTGSNLKKRVEIATKRGCSHLIVIGDDEKKQCNVALTEIDNPKLRNILLSKNKLISFLKEECNF